MNPFVQSVMDSPFFTVLTKPAQSVIKDLHNVFSTKTDVISSIIRVLATLAFFAVGVLLVFAWSPDLALKLESFWLALNAPEYMLSALVAYSGGWMISYPGGEVIRQGLRVINYCRFGDYDYFLTPTEITKVAKKIIKAESRETIELDSVKETVQEVLEFCVDKIRSNDETVQDMVSVYKRIFSSLRKGDLAPYYEHLTIIRIQEHKMAEMAQKGKAEIDKIERQIQALRDGISVGELSGSDDDLEEPDEVIGSRDVMVAMAQNSPRTTNPDMSALQMMQDRIVFEIRRIQRELALSRGPREAEEAAVLPGNVNATYLSLHRSKLLEMERKAWEEFAVILLKKKLNIEYGVAAIHMRVEIIRKKQVTLVAKLDDEDSDRPKSSIILKMKLDLEKEERALEEERARLDLEYEAVIKEEEATSQMLKLANDNKAAIDEEIDTLVTQNIDKLKDEVTLANRKIMENLSEVAKLDISIILDEEERRRLIEKLQLLNKEEGRYDVEANICIEASTLDVSTGDDYAREVLNEDDSSTKDKIKEEEKKLTGRLEELNLNIEKMHIQRRELERYNIEARASAEYARREVERLSVGHIISASMEHKYGGASTEGEFIHCPGVLSPELMPTTASVGARSLRYSERDSPASGFGIEMSKMERATSEGKDMKSGELYPRTTKGLDGDHPVVHEKRVFIDADSPIRRRTVKNVRSSNTTHQYSRHICSKDIRNKARHVSGMSIGEREEMIKQLVKRRRHIHHVAKRAERRSKMAY